MKEQHVDVLIVGAGLSGIGAACHLKARCPNKSFVILEGRGAIGGTWDLFRYPGVRSDSDMFTLGYCFRPWTGAKSIADGASILHYIRDTATTHGLLDRIRFHHRVKRASWSSHRARWLLDVECGAGRKEAQFSCGFLLMCSGYYSYAEGYKPHFPGAQSFKGRIIHPQDWNGAVAYRGARVIVIGSGATAVTLVPELAKEAAHVTLLQRSPSYVVAWPDEDAIGNALRRRLPAKAAYAITRWKNVARGMHFYRICKRKPERAKAMILEGVRAALGADYDVGRHFTPHYKPWDQRLCLAPNGDLFRSIKEQKTEVVTGEIATFTETGLMLDSGERIDADLIITATGLKLEMLGGAELIVDGERVDPAAALSYKGAMFSNVPNLAAVFGYINASWTLKADLIARYVCRLITYMEKHGHAQCTPRLTGDIERLPWVDFTSGYVRRALDALPKQGSRKPWRVHQNYVRDLLALRLEALNDGVLTFTPAVKAVG